MKKFVIGLLVIGLTSLGHSQNVNMDYLEKVQDETMSEPVRILENKASRFNVTKLPEFDGRNASFKTIFKGTKGFIIATYDKTGKILTTLERFKDVKLPVPVRNSLYKEFPKWSVNNIAYLVSYKNNKYAKKIYKIRIGKDNLKRNLKIDSEGNML